MSSHSTVVHSTKISTTNLRLPLAQKAKKIAQALVTGLLATAALFSAQSHAQIQPMETVTVIYRSSFDYALYQQTTEMLTRFNRELPQKNIARARQDNVAMAKEFGFLIQEANELVSFEYNADELQQNLIANARADNQKMAKQLGFFTNQSNELANADKYPEKLRVLSFSE
ncbi:hypothetical protein [Shewanella goraebulensis]|uniref:hypothetical protein n=1 Tax=Shewanella goraebulensis TaxID=3050637 RepID=UPI00254CD09B|nr:hypothetical protein [Shewanella goraebulensis]